MTTLNYSWQLMPLSTLLLPAIRRDLVSQMDQWLKIAAWASGPAITLVRAPDIIGWYLGRQKPEGEQIPPTMDSRASVETQLTTSDSVSGPQLGGQALTQDLVATTDERRLGVPSPQTLCACWVAEMGCQLDGGAAGKLPAGVLQAA